MTESYEPSKSEIAAYIEKMVTELAGLARSSRLEMLAYLLDVAREEATARLAEGRNSLRR